MKKITVLLTIVLLALSACNTSPKPKPYVFAPSLNSPSVKIGDVDMQFNKTFPLPGIRKMPVEISYFPLEDAVCLKWRMDFITYYQFWDSDGREEFTRTLAVYKEAFENRSFGRGSRRTKRQYGTASGYIIWQMTAFTIQARAENIVDFGYYFVEKSPYFTINQRDVKYEDSMSRDNNRHIPEMSMYLTRAQADELAAFFAPEFLNGISPVNQSIRSIEADFEDY